MPLLLAMLALATTGSAQRAPDPKALFERAAQALAARDYATAERGFREVLKLDPRSAAAYRSEEHTSELQSRLHIVCRLLLEQKTDACINDPGRTSNEAEALRRSFPRGRAPMKFGPFYVAFSTAYFLSYIYSTSHAMRSPELT